MQEEPELPGSESAFPSLLDGAVGSREMITDDLEGCRRIAADPSRSMQERLEAYEDLIASEVGDTRLTRARNLEREHGIRQLFLKFEGGNPTGTQKDRIAFAQVHDAMRRGFEAVTVATCGNYGAAIAFAAALAGMRCVIHIPEAYTTRRLDEMEQAGGEILRVPGDYEAAVEASKQAAEKHELYDANPGGANTLMQLVAYGGHRQRDLRRAARRPGRRRRVRLQRYDAGRDSSRVQDPVSPRKDVANSEASSPARRTGRTRSYTPI